MLKILSPIQLCFCLLLFLLPWVEVQCMPKPLPPGARPDPMMAGMKDEPVTVASQSGLQIATGGLSKMEMRDGGMGPGRGAQQDMVNIPTPDGAPLLFLFPLAVVLGIVFGFLPRGGLSRKLAVFSCCMAAIGAIGVQAAMGFPIQESTETWVKSGASADMLGEENTIRVAWSFFLYTALLFLVGATSTAFLGGGGKPPTARRRYADETDGRGEYDDRRDEGDPEGRTTCPGASKAAGILLIIGGGVATIVSVIVVIGAVLAGDRGGSLLGFACLFVPPFIITLFGLMAGIRTVAGNSTEPIFNGVLSLIFAVLFGGVAGFLFLYGAAAFGVGLGRMIGGMLMVFSAGFLIYGLLFLATGVLLLVGRGGYVEWRKYRKQLRRAAEDRRRGRDDEDDRPRRRPAEDDEEEGRPRRRSRRDD